MSASVWDVIAGVALAAGDLLALFSAFSAALVLLTRLASWIIGRQSRLPERFLTWSVLGLALGAIGLVSLIRTGGEGPVGISRLSVTNVGLLLLGALLLLALSMLVPRRRAG